MQTDAAAVAVPGLVADDDVLLTAQFPPDATDHLPFEVGEDRLSGLVQDRLGQPAGGDKRSLELYQSFRDPQSFPRRDLQELPFMAVGPVSPLAFSGKPLFFTAFTDPDEFVRLNNLSAP